MTWARHAPASTYCYVVRIADGVRTACVGSWPSGDRDVEWSDAPMHEERCECCERQRIAMLPVERALAELRDTAFDLGGES